MDDLVANSGGTVTGSGNLYNVHEDVTINLSATLTIDPGTTLKFDSGTKLQIFGTLIAEGTEEDQITFTSSKLIPIIDYWNGILFEDASRDSECIIKYSKIIENYIYN